MSIISGKELKEFNAASLSGTYQNFGSALSSPCYYAYFVNKSDVDAYITSDGSSNQIRLPSNSTVPMTFFSWHNHYIKGSSLFAKGAQLQIKQVTAPGTGTIFVNLLTTR